MSYYLIRIGEGSKYINEARKGNYAAIGWNEIEDLSKFKSLEELKSALEKKYQDYSPNQLGNVAGQLSRFGFELSNGDMVLSPKGSGEYYVGKIGDYYYESSPKGDCPYKHRRKVEWLENILLKEDMSTRLVNSTNAIQTIFSIDKHSEELNALIKGDKFTPAEKPERIRDIVLSALLELDGQEFELFIKHLLEVLGFQAEATQYVRDGGIDVMGTLHAEGLAEIKLQVQAKRYESKTIGSKVVRELKGSLSLDEHGCIITTSSFTTDAIEDASKAGHKTIKLIDGNDLAGLILEHFDELDDNYKKLFQVRKKKDFNIEEQFESVNAELESVLVEIEAIESTKDGKPWDTMVCSAKEGGFKSAFLDQKAWWAVRIHPSRLPKIKYLAMYQVAPISKITHYGEVAKVEPYEDSGKYKIYLKKEPVELKSYVSLGNNSNLKPQGPKYALLQDILKAKTLEDIFSKN